MLVVSALLVSFLLAFSEEFLTEDPWLSGYAVFQALAIAARWMALSFLVSPDRWRSRAGLKELLVIGPCWQSWNLTELP